MKILELIREIKTLHPELRVGQIIDNALATVARPNTDIDIFYIADITLEAGLEMTLKTIKEDEPKKKLT